ncbi:MAG: hypothetical protein M1816_004908 [Peltula sp. TS41687]|nr:MAG: hypothetical protein M1816_004908 [Peltula sp. TS41687]
MSLPLKRRRRIIKNRRMPTIRSLRLQSTAAAVANHLSRRTSSISTYGRLAWTGVAAPSTSSSADKMVLLPFSTPRHAGKSLRDLDPADVGWKQDLVDVEMNREERRNHIFF